MRIPSGLAAVVCLVAISGPLDATTIIVPDDFGRIQDAINAAVDGDVVAVRPGTYNENIDFEGKAITVQSVAGPIVTTIDGRQAYPVVTFENAEGADSRIEGFTLTNGDWFRGGGIDCGSTSPTIKNNIIVGNRANTWGGGIYCYFNSSPTITGNTISNNSAGDNGGGISCDNKSLAVITDNIITGNSAGEEGGGLHINWESAATITNNAISGNSANDYGGGIYCDTSSPTLTNNIIARNSSNHSGGGLWFSRECSPIITNNTISGNSASVNGGGIACESTYDSSLVVSNTIFWDNSALSGPEIWLGDGSMFYTATFTISYSDVEGGQSLVYVDPDWTLNWGSGNIDADPLFADAPSDDYHLTVNSPCRDTGDNTAPSLPDEDLEGDPRIADSTVDMGADEFYPHLYHLGAVVPGNPLTLKVVGTPSATVILALGAGIQDPPQSTLYGDLWLSWPIQPFSIGAMPADGVLSYLTTVPGWWLPGGSKPLQALVGPIGNPTSVLTNLETLVVE